MSNHRHTRQVEIHLSYQGDNALEALALATHHIQEALANLPEPLRQRLAEIRQQKARLAAPQSVPVHRLTHKNGALQ
jgi:hypothetical protein